MTMSAFKADMCGALVHVRFGSLADILRREGMSALPPKADICSALGDVDKIIDA